MRPAIVKVEICDCTAGCPTSNSGRAASGRGSDKTNCITIGIAAGWESGCRTTATSGPI